MIPPEDRVPAVPEFLQPALLWRRRLSPQLHGRALESGVELGEGLGFHHDGAARALALQKLAGCGGLGILFEGYAGSYVSISADFPAKQARRFDRGSIIGAVAGFETAPPEAAYWRLNLRGAASTFRPAGLERRQDRWLVCEFELAGLTGPGVEGGWADLLLPPVGTGALKITDIWLYHRPRAGF